MTDGDLQTIYTKVFEDAIKLSMNYNPQQIAATYMAIGCRIYKTVLKDDDFIEVMKTIHKTPIEPYPSTTIH
jgi:hypothetical protein